MRDQKTEEARAEAARRGAARRRAWSSSGASVCVFDIGLERRRRKCPLSPHVDLTCTLIIQRYPQAAQVKVRREMCINCDPFPPQIVKDPDCQDGLQTLHNIAHQLWHLVHASVDVHGDGEDFVVLPSRTSAASLNSTRAASRKDGGGLEWHDGSGAVGGNTCREDGADGVRGASYRCML